MNARVLVFQKKNLRSDEYEAYLQDLDGSEKISKLRCFQATISAMLSGKFYVRVDIFEGQFFRRQTPWKTPYIIEFKTLRKTSGSVERPSVLKS